MNSKVTFKYWLDKRRANSEGKYPLKMAVTFQRNTRRYSIIKYVDSKLHYLSVADFNNISNNMPPDNWTRREFTQLINNLSAFKLQCYEIQEGLGSSFSFNKFKDRLSLLRPITSADRTRIVKYEIEEVAPKSYYLIDGYIGKLNSFSDNSVSTKELYILSYKKLVQYLYPQHEKYLDDIKYDKNRGGYYTETNFKIEYDDITYGNLKSFSEDVNISQSTIAIYLRNLRAVYNYSIDKGYISRNVYPFRNNGNKKATITTGGRREQHILDEHQINSLLNLPLVPHSRAEFGRDFWLISLLCSGANLTDILSLKKTDISNDYIVFDRTKTRTTKTNKKRITIYIMPLLRQLMEKYREEEGEFYFPFLNGYTDSVETKKARVKNLVKKMNIGLKYILSDNPQLNLHKLTGYDARYTFANLCKAKDMPYSFIQEAMGHSDKSVTDVYLDSYPREKIRELTLKLFEGFPIELNIEKK